MRISAVGTALVIVACGGNVGNDPTVGTTGDAGSTAAVGVDVSGKTQCISNVLWDSATATACVGFSYFADNAPGAAQGLRSCTIELPPSPAGSGPPKVDSASVAYVDTSGGTEQTHCIIEQSAPGCPSGTGWVVSGSGTAIVLCPTTCAMLQNPALEVTVVARCPNYIVDW